MQIDCRRWRFFFFLQNSLILKIIVEHYRPSKPTTKHWLHITGSWISKPRFSISFGSTKAKKRRQDGCVRDKMISRDDWQRVITVFRNDLSRDLNDNGLDSVHDNQRSPARYVKNRWHEKELFYGTITGTITRGFVDFTDCHSRFGWNLQLNLFQTDRVCRQIEIRIRQPNNLKNCRAEINGTTATQDCLCSDYGMIKIQFCSLLFFTLFYHFMHRRIKYYTYIFVENESSDALHPQASLVLWSQARHGGYSTYFSVRIAIIIDHSP